MAKGTIAGHAKVEWGEYISWVNGTLLLNGTGWGALFRKWSSYYSTPVPCDPAVGKEKVYGKLDRKDNLHAILACFRQMVPFEVVEKDTGIYLAK